MTQLTKPFATYPHTRICGDLVFISGQGCRDPQSDAYAGTTIENGSVVSYDIAAQTRGVLKNIERALASEQLTLADLIDVQVFLKTMEDFDQMNQVWNETFSNCQAPTRTTVAVIDLPGHNFIEMKAIASKRNTKG